MKSNIKQTVSAIKREIPVATVGIVWPNGSGVFSTPDEDRSRVELGRIVREGNAWRAWSLTSGGYTDLGTCATQVAGIAMLPEIQRGTDSAQRVKASLKVPSRPVVKAKFIKVRKKRI